MDTIPLDDGSTHVSTPPAASTPVVAPPAILEELPDIPELPSDASTAAARSAGEGCCPSCGNPFPAGNRLCLNCGYERIPGSRPPTVVALPSRPLAQPNRVVAQPFRPAAQPASPVRRPIVRRTPRIRPWEDYQNPLLALLDRSAKVLAILLFTAMVVFVIGAPFFFAWYHGEPIHAGISTLILVWELVALVLFFVIMLPISAWGINISSDLFRFELPSDAFSRLLAIFTIAAIPLVLAFVSIATDPNPAPPYPSISLLQVPILWFVLSYVSFLFFFHMRLVESIVTYLFFLLFAEISSIVYGLIMWPISYLILKALNKMVEEEIRKQRAMHAMLYLRDALGILTS